MTKKRLTKAQFVRWAKMHGACSEGLRRFVRMGCSPAQWWQRSKTEGDLWWVAFQAEVSNPSPGISKDWNAYTSAGPCVVGGKYCPAFLRKHYRWETAEALILADLERTKR